MKYNHAFRVCPLVLNSRARSANQFPSWEAVCEDFCVKTSDLPIASDLLQYERQCLCVFAGRYVERGDGIIPRRQVRNTKTALLAVCP